jgi:hypothetical protein
MCGEVAELAVDYVTIGACLSLATSGNPSAIGAPYAAIALHERIIRGVGFPIYCIASKLDNVLYKLHQMMQQWKADREDR